MTVTCRSEKIFQMLRTDNPVVKTILASVQAHSQKYKDAGLFTVLLTVKYVGSDSLPLCSFMFQVKWDMGYWALGTWYWALSTWYWALGTWYWALGTHCQVRRLRFLCSYSKSLFVIQ